MSERERCPRCMGDLRSDLLHGPAICEVALGSPVYTQMVKAARAPGKDGEFEEMDWDVFIQYLRDVKQRCETDRAAMFDCTLKIEDEGDVRCYVDAEWLLEYLDRTVRR